MRAFVSTYSKTLQSLAVAFSVATLAEASAMPSTDADQRSIRCYRTRIAEEFRALSVGDEALAPAAKKHKA